MPNTFYIRHTWKLDVDAATLDFLWSHHKIAVHFPEGLGEPKLGPEDNSSLNPEEYVGSGRSALRVLNTMARDGGYVLAEFREHSECLVGKIEPGTSIERYEGKWGKLSKLEGKPAILKTLQLTTWQIVPQSRAAKLLAGRPRQGTVMRWPSARKMIENVVEGRIEPPSIRDLIPTFQEVLCSEFLRLPTPQTGLPRLASLILPVGRTLRDIDIYGMAEPDGLIVAQVTLQPSAECQRKVEALKRFDAKYRIFFCDDPSQRKSDGIHYYPMEEVYARFASTPEGTRWLAEIAR